MLLALSSWNEFVGSLNFRSKKCVSTPISSSSSTSGSISNIYAISYALTNPSMYVSFILFTAINIYSSNVARSSTNSSSQSPGFIGGVSWVTCENRGSKSTGLVGLDEVC